MSHLLHELKEAVTGHGHTCTCDDCMEEHHEHYHHGFDRVMVIRLIFAAVLFLSAMICEDFAETASFILFVGCILVAGYDVFLGAIGNLFSKKLFDETLLMSIVALAAIGIGEAEEGASVMLLYQIGELFQSYAVGKVRANIEGLMENRSPETTEILKDVRSRKAPKGETEEFITRFCRVYTPVVLGIALLVAVCYPIFFDAGIIEGVYKALVLMVIACPCAIVISVPLSYFAGIGGASSLGILFKNTGAMDAVSKTLGIIFDKRNVLESEKLHVSSVKAVKMDEPTMMRIAAHACAYSSDPHAEGIKSAYDGVIYIELVQDFEEEEGAGVSVLVDNVPIILGDDFYVRMKGLDIGEDKCMEDAVYLGVNGQYVGRVQFMKNVKPDVPGTISVLSLDKKKELALLAEDSAPDTERFAGQIGIQQYYSECKPADKIAVVKDMRSRNLKGTLVFVGDPVSDAECLGAADIGVALNGADSDAAIRAADVVIMDDSPSRVVTAIDAAKHTRKIVMQNIIFALAFKVIILVLDVFATCPLWLAVFADVGVALLAVLNSLRAFRIKTSRVILSREEE